MAFYNSYLATYLERDVRSFAHWFAEVHRDEKRFRIVTVGIDDHLKVPKQAGCILDFINKDRRRMTLEKSARFLFSLLGFDGEIEGDKRMFRDQSQEAGGFAGLSGPG